MQGSGVSWRSVVMTLLGAGLLAGLFMMHGVTASPSPVHVSEPLPISMAHMPTQAMGHAPAGLHETAGPVDGAGHLTGCAAGTVCFALLTIALLLFAGTAGAVTLLPVRVASGRAPSSRRGPPRARPPSVYQLSVLRL